jgi:hypothetical protein
MDEKRKSDFWFVVGLSALVVFVFLALGLLP